MSYVKVCVLAQCCALRPWRSEAWGFPKAAKVGVQSSGFTAASAWLSPLTRVRGEEQD